MLTNQNLKSQVDGLWDKLWSGGLSNPLDAIEQLSFLLFMKRLDEADTLRERQAKKRNQEFKSIFKDTRLRWSHFTQLDGQSALKLVKEEVFPFIRTMGGDGGSFATQMTNAEFKINKPSLFIEACRMIDAMAISSQNQDVQGDLYEYLLSRLNTAGTNGQFRTPRHIIRMMVKMIDPKPGERVCDPAAGTCGFIVNAWQHILETHTRPEDIEYDEDGYPHNISGALLKPEEREFCQKEAFRAFDNDSGMVMLRIGSMNLILHGLENPQFQYADTLSKAYNEEKLYDVVLANPPFKGAIDAGDINPTLPTKGKKTEILFLHLFLRILESGGRAAVIVPDGVLFGSSNAHVEIRKKLIEENRLEGVVSMPGGVFKPYAGVSTAILIFSKGGSTENIWFYDMEHDGYSLDDKRQKVAENDIPDILSCWENRKKTAFSEKRKTRLAQLYKEIEPLKKLRLKLQAEIHRLTFESAIAGDSDEKTREALRIDQEKLDSLHEKIKPLQQEINQLNRQFLVSTEAVRANKYDLSASRYRQLEQDEVYYEKPQVTLERMQVLEQTVNALRKELIKQVAE